MMMDKESVYNALYDLDGDTCVQMIMSGDVDGLIYGYRHNYPITYKHYYDSIKESNGKCLENLECIKFLEQIRVIHPHKLLLDAALYGNLEVMKYAQMKGEDITYYKVLMCVLSNPKNPCKGYVLTYLRQYGLLEDEKVIEIRQEELISKELMLELLKIPNGSIYRRFLNYISKVSFANIFRKVRAYIHFSSEEYVCDDIPWQTPFELDDIVVYKIRENNDVNQVL